jgi:hypothetical protein
MKMTKVNQKQADDNFILITIVILPLEEAALTAAALKMTMILNHRCHPKENKKMNPSLLPLWHWLPMAMMTKKVMKVKELLDVLIWQRDKSQGKLNSPPCRLRMSIVKADDKTF